MKEEHLNEQNFSSGAIVMGIFIICLCVWATIFSCVHSKHSIERFYIEHGYQMEKIDNTFQWRRVYSDTLKRIK